MKSLLFVLLTSFGMSTFAAGSITMMTGQEPIPAPPNTTYNMGVQTIDQRFYRAIQELTRGESARVTSLSSTDKARFDAIYENLTASIMRVGIVGQTCVTDFTYLYEIPLTVILGEVPEVENEALNSAVTYLVAANIEMRGSNSTRRNDCLEEPDYSRLMNAIAKSKGWIDDFYTNFTPMDMPQSHPRRDIVEPTAVSVME